MSLYDTFSSSKKAAATPVEVPPKKEPGIFDKVAGFFGAKPDVAPPVVETKPVVKSVYDTYSQTKTAKGAVPPVKPDVGTPSKSVYDTFQAGRTTKPTTPAYFGGSNPDGSTFGPSPLKDMSGRPFVEYKEKGQVASTTDKTRVSTSFDPRVASPQTKESFYNPRAVENKAQLRVALGGAYSDELDHKIAVALSGSNDKSNLRPEPKSANNDSSKIMDLQQQVVSGKKSLFDAQVELAKWKGIDIPWTPKQTSQYPSFDGFVSAVKDAWVNKVAPAIEGATARQDQTIAQPYFKPKGATESHPDYLKRLQAYDKSPEKLAYDAKVKDANTFIYKDNSMGGIIENTIKGIPNKLSESTGATLGIGAGIKQIRDNPEVAALVTPKDAVMAVPGAIVDTAKGFVTAPISGALDLYGATANALTNGKSGAVKFNIPGLGEISNAQARTIDRVKAGEDPAQVALEEGSQAIFDTLFFIGVASKGFAPRESVTAKFQGNLNNIKTEGTTIDTGPKSFREYTPPSTATPLTPKVVDAMAKQGMDLGPNYDPSLPSFFRIKSSGRGGAVTGEVVQIKPSYFDTLMKRVTPQTQLDYFRTNVKNSEAFNVDSAIKDGSVTREEIYQKGKILTPQFAEGRVNDIAGKLDQYKPGLGEEFKTKVDVNNSSLAGLVQQGENMLTPEVLATPSLEISKAIVADKVPALPKSAVIALSSKNLNVSDIKQGLSNPIQTPQDAQGGATAAITTPSAESLATPQEVTPSYYQAVPDEYRGSSPEPLHPNDILDAHSNAYQALEIATEAKVDSDLKINKRPENLPTIYEQSLKTAEHALKMANTPDEIKYWRQQVSLTKYKVDYVQKKLSETDKAISLPNENAPHSLETLKNKYQDLGQGEYGMSKADEALGQILLELDLAEKGERVMSTSNEPGVSVTFSAKPSTFPSWIPENLRSRKAIDTLLARISSVDSLSYPEKKNATAQHDFTNALLDTLDHRLGVDTKEIRNNINNNDQSKTPAKKNASTEVHKGSARDIVGGKDGKKTSDALDQNAKDQYKITQELEAGDASPSRHLRLQAELSKLVVEGKKLAREVKDATNLSSVSVGPKVEDNAVIERFSSKGSALTTKILKKLEGRDFVSKQFISDLTNSGDIKQVERDLIRDVLATMEGDRIDVPSFIDRVKTELLPLRRRSAGDAYEPVNLPSDLRGDVDKYEAFIYNSPISTYAGSVHFGDKGEPSKNYFAHTRIEDVVDGPNGQANTRRVLELQSDLFQKGRLESEKLGDYDAGYETALQGLKDGKSVFNLENNPMTGEQEMGSQVKTPEDLDEYGNYAITDPQAEKRISGLEPYKNTWQDRIVREEVKKAAEDGKTSLLFPTGDTAMKIEGLGAKDMWYHKTGTGFGAYEKVQTDDLKVGKEISDDSSPVGLHDSGASWIITDVLGDGKFKALPKKIYEDAFEAGGGGMDRLVSSRSDARVRDYEETFDISGKVDTSNPIHRFYEKEVARYLKNAYKATPFTDDKGVTWNKVEITKKMATDPIEAYRFDRNQPANFDATHEEAINEIRKLFTPEEMDINFKKEFIGHENLVGRFRHGPDVLGNISSSIDLLTKEGMVSKDTAWHEGFHGYFNLFTTPEFRNKILFKVKTASLITKGGRYSDISSYDTADKRAEEFLADDFADWKASQEKGAPEYKGFFSRMWAKFTQFLKNMRRRILGAEKLYQDIVDGKRPNTKQAVRELELSRGLELSPDDMQHISKMIDEGATRAAAKHEIEQRAIRAANKGKEISLPDESLKDILANTLNPLKGVDKPTADVFRQWHAKELVGSELARVEKKNAVITLDKARVGDNMVVIDMYEAGNQLPAVKKIFDKLYADAAHLEDTDIGYLENYIPHVYSNSAAEFNKIAMSYLQGKGLTEQEATDYLIGNKAFSPERARRLGIMPFFVKERMFDSYKEARAYGLTPKYKTISDLAAYYRGKLERAIANRYLKDTLEESGRILPDISAPPGWSNLNPQFSALSTYKAPAQVARIINDIFPDTNIKKFYPAILEKTANISGKLQDITLSGGFPSSNVNFFSNGQLIKEITAGNVGATKAYLRANSNDASLKYFDENADTIMKMAEEGIDLSGRLGKWGERSFTELVQSKEWGAAFGRGFNVAFNEKTFGSFMPQMQVGLFKKVYDQGIKRGMSEKQAQTFAGDTTKHNFGLLVDDFARSKVVRDFLKTFFFAPQFREGIIRVLENAGYSAYDFFKNPNKADPTYRRNLYLLAGMAVTYMIYNILNKQINGNYTWDNPDGRQFALRIPGNDGNVYYIEMMPGTLAFPRAIATGAIAATQGDFKTATQRFGQVFSQPIHLVTDVIGNSDYYGRPIYNDTDGTADKLKKIGAYIGLNSSHPYVREIYNIATQKSSLFQGFSAAAELPLKFSTLSKEAQARIYDEADRKAKELEVKKNDFQPKYDAIKQEIDAGNTVEALQTIQALSKEDKAVYKAIKAEEVAKSNKVANASVAPKFEEIQQLLAEGKIEEGMAIYSALSTDEKKAYKRYKAKTK